MSASHGRPGEPRLSQIRQTVGITGYPSMVLPLVAALASRTRQEAGTELGAESRHVVLEGSGGVWEVGAGLLVVILTHRLWIGWL